MSIAVLLALALVGSHQDAPKAVTYRTVAVPLDKALSGLSEASGATLKAAPVIASEVVVIAVKGASLDDVKTRLAKAVSGKWTAESDGSFTLVPDLEARGAEARDELKKRTDAMAKGLKKLQSILVPQKPGDEQGVDMSFGSPFGGMSSGSSRKLIATMSLGLRGADLAAIGPNGRVVYSTSPNAMQRPMATQNLARAVAEFVEGHNKEVQASASAIGDMDPEQKEKIEQMQKTFGVHIPEQKKIDAPPAKFLLAVERSSRFGFWGDSLDLKLIAFDAKGGVLATDTTSVDSPMDDVMMQATEEAAIEAGKEVPAKQEPPHDPKLDKAIELSKLAKELQTLTDFRSMGTTREEPSAELMEHVLRPDLYDPLSYEFSECLLALVEAEGLNLVACVPDNTENAGSMVTGRQDQTLWAFKSGLVSGGSVNYDEKDGWATLTPSNPVESRNNKVNRKALAKFLASARKTTLPSLDALAEYASVNPPIMETQVAIPSVMLVAPNAASMGMRGAQDWPMLRLYGSIGQASKLALRQGQSVPFTSLGAGGLAQVKTMVFGAGGQFQVGPEPEDRPTGLLGQAMSMAGVPPTTFKQEPTELLPNGLPAQGVLALKIAPGHFVMPEAKAGLAAMFGAIGPDEYAILRYFSEEPSMSAMASMMPKLDKFRVGDRETLDFRLVLAPDVTQRHTLIADRIAADSAVVGKDGLPKDFMAEVDKQMKLFKDGLSPFMFGREMLGGGPPPTR